MCQWELYKWHTASVFPDFRVSHNHYIWFQKKIKRSRREPARCRRHEKLLTSRHKNRCFYSAALQTRRIFPSTDHLRRTTTCSCDDNVQDILPHLCHPMNKKTNERMNCVMVVRCGNNTVSPQWNTISYYAEALTNRIKTYPNMSKDSQQRLCNLRNSSTSHESAWVDQWAMQHFTLCVCSPRYLTLCMLIKMALFTPAACSTTNWILTF